MHGFARLRRAAVAAAGVLCLSPVAGHVGFSPVTVHAAGPSGIATFTARYVSATVEADPVLGEAVGTLSCGTVVPDPAGSGISGTAGGACFNLVAFAGQGLHEITQVFPDGADDTSTTTLFQGYDMNNDNCVSCFQGDGDQAWESGGNGVIAAPIPAFPAPLQVFVRTASLHDDGVVRHSLTGTIQVTVLTSTDAQQFCSTTSGGCGEAFQFTQVCPPAPQPCQGAPYPYPSKP
jgi:hypothetical protein